MRLSLPPRVRGFTLIELMIVVAIIAILAAVALPSYRDYMMRGYVVDATTLLSSQQAQMERYYQDNRQYAAVGTFTPPCATGTAAQRTQGNFVVTCSGADLTANIYKLTATGSGPVTNFVYTVDSIGNKTSTVGAPWTTPNPNTCWVVKRGQAC